MTLTISFPSHSHPCKPNNPQFSTANFIDALWPKNFGAEDHSGSPKSGLQKFRTIALSPNITFPKNPFQINNFKLTIFQGFRSKFSLTSILSDFCLSDQFLKRRVSDCISLKILEHIYSLDDISQALEIISWQALYLTRISVAYLDFPKCSDFWVFAKQYSFEIKNYH